MSKKKDRDIVGRAVDALMDDELPAGPSEETLAAVTAQGSEWRKAVVSARAWRGLLRIGSTAAAAVLLVAAGYGFGHLSRPRAPSLEQLQEALEPVLLSSLEPVIREHLAAELSEQWGLALAANKASLREEMKEMGLGVLAASGTLTNQRLAELIEAVTSAQSYDRRWVTAALGQIELNRVADTRQLADGLQTLALHTEDQLEQTMQAVAEFCARGQTNNEFRDTEQ